MPIPSIKLPEITNTLVSSSKVHSIKYCLGMQILPSRTDISSADIFDVEVLIKGIIMGSPEIINVLGVFLRD